MAPSPVVELNRAVAVGHAHGPARALAIVDAAGAADYPLLPAVRGDLLAKLGRTAEARDEFHRAAAMTRNARERTIFEARAAELASTYVVSGTRESGHCSSRAA